MAISSQSVGHVRATVIERVGAFNVTFFNSGEVDDGLTGAKNWTATERDDVANEIMMWTTILGNPVNTPRPIELHLIWNDLPGITLGQSSNVFTVTSGTARTMTERLWRTQVNTSLAGSGYDTQIAFDSGTPWVTGLFGPSVGQWDFRTVIAHELGHSLGFVSAYDSASDTFKIGTTSAVTEFDTHLRDAATGGDTPVAGGTGTPGDFNQTANPVYFEGTNADAANGGNRPAIYAPASYLPGSSLTHLNDATFPNSLMKHALNSGTSVRKPSVVEVAIMQDLGWTIVANKTWDKGAGSLSWTSSNNWDTDGAPGSTNIAAFTNTGLAGGDTIDLGGNTIIDGLSFDTTTDFTIGGASGTLTLNRAFVVRSDTSSGTQTISRPMAWSGVANWHVEGAGQLAVSGAIGSTSGLTKTGLGVLSLSGGSTFSGVVTVDGGSLDISNPSALGSSAGGTTVITDAALEMLGSISVSSEALAISGSGPSGGGALRSLSGANGWSGNVTLSGSPSVGVDTGSLTLSGTVSGATSLTKVGAGTLVLSHANTYTLGTNVNGGILSVSADNFLGSGPIGLASGGTLQVTGSSAVSSAKTLTVNAGGGTLNVTNSAGLSLSGTITLSSGQTLTKSGGTLSVTAPLAWGAGSGLNVSTGTMNLAPAAAAAVSVADNTAQLTIGSGATVTVNGTNNDPFTDDSVTTRHVNVMNNSTAAGFQITNGSVSVGGVDGTGNTSVTLNAALAADHIKQNNLTIGDPTHGAPSVTVRRSGGTPQGLDSQVSVVNSLSLANNGATIVPPPPGGYSSPIRQYFGRLDLVNNDLIITGGSHALFTELEDMVRAGLFSNGASGITSSEALSSGDYANKTWLGSIYNGFDNDNNPNTPDAPILNSFDGVPLVGGEMLLKYTWLGDTDLDGTVTSLDFGQMLAGLSHADPVNQAINPWLFGDFDYNGIVDSLDYGLLLAGIGAGGDTIHLPEPGGLVLLGVGLGLAGLCRWWRCEIVARC